MFTGDVRSIHVQGHKVRLSFIPALRQLRNGMDCARNYAPMVAASLLRGDGWSVGHLYETCVNPHIQMCLHEFPNLPQTRISWTSM